MIKRRDFLHASALAGLCAYAPRWAEAVALDRPLPLDQAAAEAWLYGLMLIESARARSLDLQSAAPNSLLHMRALATPSTRLAITPNNDTLFSMAWLDLAAGPIEFTMPNVGERYASYAFIDMYGNHFAVLGARTTGNGGGSIKLVPPDGRVLDHSTLRAPTRWVRLLIRLMVEGEEDVRAVNALQSKLRLDAPKTQSPTRVYAKRTAPWREYFASVQALVLENAPPLTDQAFFKRIAPLGLDPSGGFNARRFSTAEQSAIAAGVEAAQRQLTKTPNGRVVDSWIYPKDSLGNYGQDYFYRAQTALNAPSTLPAPEAMYMRPVAPDGSSLLPSSVAWRLHFDKDRLPPVDAFWSLSMYQQNSDGQLSFFENPLKRYVIGSRSKNLRYNADGSLDIWMTRTPPSRESVNWLPTPPTEKFLAVFRAYLPRAELLDGSYLLPPLATV